MRSRSRVVAVAAAAFVPLIVSVSAAAATPPTRAATPHAKPPAVHNVAHPSAQHGKHAAVTARRADEAAPQVVRAARNSANHSARHAARHGGTAPAGRPSSPRPTGSATFVGHTGTITPTPTPSTTTPSTTTASTTTPSTTTPSAGPTAPDPPSSATAPSTNSPQPTASTTHTPTSPAPSTTPRSTPPVPFAAPMPKPVLFPIAVTIVGIAAMLAVAGSGLLMLTRRAR